ncbi:outer membrane channel protein [Planctomycetes bacterium CA13]|uniref:Outer membrane channel protein n=2 Tax=Novipirellula herctigrandis TaxID=2527986 RepID=A0A5C5YYX4_9BACT|nr:outer membrane channel protein [Planctomycetes bacterium CA13]
MASACSLGCAAHRREPQLASSRSRHSARSFQGHESCPTDAGSSIAFDTPTENSLVTTPVAYRGRSSVTATSATEGHVSETDIRHWTEGQCVDSAIANHHRNDAAHHRIHASMAQLKQAESTFWPQLNGNFSVTRIRQGIDTKVSASALGIPSTSLLTIPLTGERVETASLDTTLPLYVGGARKAGVAMADAGVQIARQQAVITKNDVVRVARRAYYGTILTRQMLELGLDTRDRLQVTQELTKGMLDAGSETVDRTDYLRGEVAVATVESMIAEANAKTQLARTALANAVGANASEEIDSVEAVLPYQPIHLDLNEMIGEAYAFRPDWKQMQDVVRLAASQVDLAKSGLHPKLLASGALIQARDNLGGVGVVTPNGDNWRVGLYAQVPLFSGFKTLNEIRQAKARYCARQSERALLHDGIGVQVKKAYIELIQARDQIAATDRAWQKAIENRELLIRGYQIGMTESKDVIEAQMTETAMKRENLMALYHWNVSLVELDHATGRCIEQMLR